MKKILFALGLLAAQGALAQEDKLVLKDGPGREKTQVCVACHSVDYIPMNSPFLDKAGWVATVNKMKNAFGAPIASEDVDAIATYLAANYGKPAK